MASMFALTTAARVPFPVREPTPATRGSHEPVPRPSAENVEGRIGLKLTTVNGTRQKREGEKKKPTSQLICVEFKISQFKWLLCRCRSHQYRLWLSRHNEKDGNARSVELTCCASLLHNSRVRFFNRPTITDK